MLLIALGVGSCAELETQDASHTRKTGDAISPAVEISPEHAAVAADSTAHADSQEMIDLVPTPTPRRNAAQPMKATDASAQPSTQESAGTVFGGTMVLEVSTVAVSTTDAASNQPCAADWIPTPAALDALAWSVTGSSPPATMPYPQPDATPTHTEHVTTVVAALAAPEPQIVSVPEDAPEPEPASTPSNASAVAAQPASDHSATQSHTATQQTAVTTEPVFHAPTPVKVEPPAQPFRPIIADVAPPLNLPFCITQRPVPVAAQRPQFPAPPTASVALTGVSATSAPPTTPIIPYFLLAAMVLAAITTLGLGFVTSAVSDATGVARRSMTIPCRIVLAIGTLATAIIGCCRFGAVISTSIGGQITCAVLAFVGVTLCIGAGMWLVRSISAPLSITLHNIRALASSNLLIEPINSTQRDELGELARATDKLAASIKDIISEVAISSSDVAAAASELAIGAQGMSAAAGQVSNQCALVAGDASSTGRLATSGGRSLQQAAEEMARIDEFVHASSDAVRDLTSRGDQVARIVTLIDDIADRTHLVALNASIEASKAGPNGRAFAVLAEEVRRLAERAQKATEEAAATVRAVQSDCRAASDRMTFGATQIKQSADFTGRAGHDLAEIIRTAGGVSSMIQTISSAAEEAGAGAAQSAGAAAQLSTRASDLKAMVDRFRIDTTSFMRHASVRAS